MLLVTGSNGQLGTELKALLPDAIFADIADLDITELEQVKAFVSKHNIDTIINCAAYTAVDKAESDVELCTKINVLGIENLAKSGAKIVHISTDYVFDGTGHKPYLSTDMASPQSVYGATKLAGENALFENAETAIVIRTAWLYSIYGNNFLKTMMRLGKERDSLNVVADQVGSPTYAGDLAKAIVDILPQVEDGKRAIYHYTNDGVASWYDFALEIMEQLCLDCKISPIASFEYPTPAKRPFYSILDKSEIKRDFNIKIPHWKESLKKCLSQF